MSQLPAVASMTWVLLSVLWLIFQTQGISPIELNSKGKALATKQTSELTLYEVVHPRKLHSLHKRETENNGMQKRGDEEKYESEIRYQIRLKGEEIILQLQKTTHLLGPNYTETFYSPRGEEIITSPPDLEYCYYEGRILNEKDSVASISTCDGLRGYFTHHHQSYLIQPLKGTVQAEHAILTYNQEELHTANYTCGVRHVGRKHGPIRKSRSPKSAKQEDFLQAQKYLDLFLVLDNTFYNIHERNITRMRSFVFDVLNLLNVIYNTIDVEVTLVGMEIWSDSDKIKVEPKIGTTFNNFLKWHKSTLGKKMVHDHAQLLSGVAFNNRRVGMAASNSLCSSSSVAVIEAERKNNVALVGVMSHELGHVLGMPDIPYDTKCPSGSCVMNQYLSSKFPKDFSTICRTHFESYLLSQKPKCLLQLSAPRNGTIPVCGNQLVEVGEDCDCGSPKACTNACCEARTCKFKPGTNCGDTRNPVTE